MPLETRTRISPERFALRIAQIFTVAHSPATVVRDTIKGETVEQDVWAVRSDDDRSVLLATVSDELASYSEATLTPMLEAEARRVAVEVDGECREIILAERESELEFVTYEAHQDAIRQARENFDAEIVEARACATECARGEADEVIIALRDQLDDVKSIRPVKRFSYFDFFLGIAVALGSVAITALGIIAVAAVFVVGLGLLGHARVRELRAASARALPASKEAVWVPRS